MLNVQIFGLKNSHATRAAERFFKERRDGSLDRFEAEADVPWRNQEIRRAFWFARLLDSEGKAYIDAGLKYLKVSDAELLGRIEHDPKLLRLPLVRAANRLSIGQDEESWKAMIAERANEYSEFCKSPKCLAIVSGGYENPGNSRSAYLLRHARSDHSRALGPGLKMIK